MGISPWSIQKLGKHRGCRHKIAVSFPEDQRKNICQRILIGDVRCFRLDRIGAAKIEDKNFKLDHSKNFLASIEEYTASL